MPEVHKREYLDRVISLKEVEEIFYEVLEEGVFLSEEQGYQMPLAAVAMTKFPEHFVSPTTLYLSGMIQ